MKKFISIIILFVFLFPQGLCKENIWEAEIDVEKEICEQLKMEPVYVSLDDCLLIALENNFNLKSATARYEEKVWDYKNSLAAFLPEAGLRGFATYYNGQLLVGGALVDRLEETALFAGGYVSHDLTEGGKTIFQMMSQKNLKKAEAFKLSTSREEVLYNVAINYYNLLEAKVVTENLITSYKERAYQYEIAKAKYEVGAGEKFDVVRTDIEVQQAKVNLLIAFNQFGFNKIKLANSMGVEVSSPLMPIEKSIKEYKLFDDSEDGEKIYEIALVNQTDLMALEKEIASLKNERSEILCEFVPKADFYAQYSFQGTVSSGTYPNTQIGVNVEIPIGENLGVGTMTKVKAMDKQIQAKEYELEQAKRDLKEEILISHARSNEAAKKIELFSKQFESSTISTQIATGKYFEGEGILLDVIQAQTEKTRISVELSSARAEYNKSQIELLFESGLITIPAILKNYKP